MLHLAFCVLDCSPNNHDRINAANCSNGSSYGGADGGADGAGGGISSGGAMVAAASRHNDAGHTKPTKGAVKRDGLRARESASGVPEQARISSKATATATATATPPTTTTSLV